MAETGDSVPSLRRSLPAASASTTARWPFRTVAEGIVNAINAAHPDEPDIAGTEPLYIDDVESVNEFTKYDFILGCPTWNTGADEERSGTAWDDLYYGDVQGVSLAGKKVAVFGCGDSIGYENCAMRSTVSHAESANAMVH